MPKAFLHIELNLSAKIRQTLRLGPTGLGLYYMVPNLLFVTFITY